MGKNFVLLVDDHTLVRTGIRRVLDDSDDFEVIGEAGDTASAVEQASALQPDIVLVDISLPDGSGIEATPAIREAAPGCRVVILTQHESIHHVEAALRAGASGYWLKSTSAADLLTGLRTVAEGNHSLSPALAEAMLKRLIPSDDTSAPRARLTSRETEVLRLVVNGQSSKQISLELQISPRTAETHRANLMSKLGFSCVADLVRFAIREGIVEP